MNLADLSPDEIEDASPPAATPTADAVKPADGLRLDAIAADEIKDVDGPPDVKAARAELERIRATSEPRSFLDNASDYARGIPGKIKHGAVDVAGAIGAMGARALDTATLGLYSKGRDAAYSAISPGLADATRGNDAAFHAEHPFLSDTAGAAGAYLPGGAPAKVAQIVGQGVRAAAPALTGVAGRLLTGAATGAGTSGATTLAEDVTAGVPVGDALENAGKSALIGTVFGGGIEGARAGVGRFSEGSAGRVANRLRNKIGEKTGSKIQGAVQAKADEIDDVITRHPVLEKVAANPEKLKSAASDILAAKEDQMRKMTDEASARMATDTHAEMLAEASAARAHAEAIREALPDAKDKVSRVSDSMIVGSEGVGPLDKLAAKVERKRLKYESIVNKEDRARAKESYQAARDELATAKKNANASEIAEARGLEPADSAVPTAVDGDVTVRKNWKPPTYANGGAGTYQADDGTFVTKKPVDTGGVPGQVDYDPTGFSGVTAKMTDPGPLVVPTAAKAAALEAKAAALEKQATNVKKSGGGIRLGDVQNSIRRLAGEVEKDPDRVKVADAIASELDAIKRSWGDDPNKIVPAAAVRKYASGLQRRGYHFKTEGTQAEAAQEASKAVLDHVNKHITGVGYAEGIASTDPTIQKYYQLNDDMAALHRIEAAADAKLAKPEGNRGHLLSPLIHLATHSTAGALGGAVHSPLPLLVSLAAMEGVPRAGRAADRFFARNPGLTSAGEAATRTAPLTGAILAPKPTKDEAVAKLYAGASKGQDPAMLLREAVAMGVDQTIAAGIIASARRPAPEARP